MSRLIFIPQYPAKLRYQEWWIWYLPLYYGLHFDEVVQLKPTDKSEQSRPGQFSLIKEAVEFECRQIEEYMKLKLKDDDVLLLCDLSFPGLFSNVLIHKRPFRAYAVCHATSRNRHDLFAPVREIKWPIEKASAQLFTGIFVGSQYHASKLGWSNTHVTGMPHTPVLTRRSPYKQIRFLSTARQSMQKINKRAERELERRTKTQIYRIQCNSWADYSSTLSRSEYLIVTSKEETYGYQIIDAILCGTIPIAPNCYSYPELLPPEYLYEQGSVDSIIETINRVKEPPPLPRDNFFQRTSWIMSNGL